MSTTSTVPAVLEALLTTLNADYLADDDLAHVKAHEAWPGPDATSEMLIFGEVSWDEYVIPTIKAGRQARQEGWSVPFEVWVVGDAGTSPTDPSASRDRAFAILAVAEDAVAEDPWVGLGRVAVQHVQIRPLTAGPHQFEKGWAYVITGRFQTEARLQ